MSACKYCAKPENKQSSPCLECVECESFVHLDCLLSDQTPGNFDGDIFFEFTCADCNTDKNESFVRERTSWLYVVVLVLNHLRKTRMRLSNEGFFHKHTHISSFISSNWVYLFDSAYKRRRNFISSFSSLLNTYNNIFFESGDNLLNESGWWKLIDGYSPALVKYLHTEMIIWKQKDRRHNVTLQSSKITDFEIIQNILRRIDFDDILPTAYKMKLQREIDEKESDGSLNDRQESNQSSPKSESKTDGFSIDKSDMGNSDVDDFPNYLIGCDDSLFNPLDDMLTDFEEPSTSNTQTFKNDQRSTPSDDNLDVDDLPMNADSNAKLIGHKTTEYNPPVPKSLFSDNVNSKVLPWINNDKKHEKCQSMFLSEYSEAQMLNQLNNLRRKGDFQDKSLNRLRSKLSLRKLKRRRHLPLFDLDKLVSKLAYYPEQDTTRMHVGNRRILDHFQHDNKSSEINYAVRLVNSNDESQFISPYSGNLLKPYIWRDNKTYPLWLKVADELKTRVNKNNTDSRAPIDYCYVRPYHIAAINNMCAQFFWPGIDLSDTLLYPEYSCVALYKKLIVGFAFLIPDVSYNQAYLSFLLTRPEWRNSGIGSFMLYHLTQTCIDKDITLHVSASNPAIFLYQKFGFKVEEFLQEFYDKYFPPESKECKHALFLRLTR